LSFHLSTHSRPATACSRSRGVSCYCRATGRALAPPLTHSLRRRSLAVGRRVGCEPPARVFAGGSRQCWFGRLPFAAAVAFGGSSSC
jgi:hypothetical protein